MPSFGDAVALAAYGWRVHPLHSVSATGVCTCKDGARCNSPGKHPRVKAWDKEATNDEEKISEWWDKWPMANVGVVLGPSSGIIDLDCDSDEGEKFLLDLFADCEQGLETPTFRSSRGRHRLYKYTSELPNSDKGHWKIPGVDVDFKIGNGNKGSFCVFPPSLHASGAKYQWEKHPDDYEILELPREVIARLHAIAIEGGFSTSATQGNKPQRKPKEHFDRILDGVQEGERNESAASLIGHSIANMRDPTDKHQQSVQWRFIKSWNAANNNPPLDLQELESTFNSILKRHLDGLRQNEERALQDHFSEPTQPGGDKTVAPGWALTRVDADPHYYKLRSPKWEGYVRLTDDDLLNSHRVRREVLSQKAICLRADFKKFWDGGKNSDGAIIHLAASMTREDAPFDEHLENGVASRLYERFQESIESREGKPSADGRPTRISGTIWFRVAYFREQDRFLSENDQRLSKILRQVCEPKDKFHRNAKGILQRYRLVNQEGLEVLKNIVIQGAEAYDESIG